MGQFKPESPIFDGKNHGFRLRFSLKPIQWIKVWWIPWWFQAHGRHAGGYQRADPTLGFQSGFLALFDPASDFTGVSADFNGVSLDFNGVSWDFNGVSWDFNGISMDLYGILLEFNRILIYSWDFGVSCDFGWAAFRLPPAFVCFRACWVGLGGVWWVITSCSHCF